MGKIVLLDDLTINKIAAGEVIERPASVVKEMVENSIDAGAKNITVEIKNGGISLIKIIDDGSGMAEDDMEIAFERHATSKIREAGDLETVTTMGFRGEALASIAAIANVEMVSKRAEDETGHKIVIEGGKILEKSEIGCPVGTQITVKNLFFNTPVRYKFLKKDFTEAGYIEDVITRLALVNKDVSLKLINTGKTIIQTNGNNDSKSVIYSIYGKDIANGIIDIDYTYEDIKVTGVIGKAEIARSNRSHQQFFVNNRFVKDKNLTAAVDQAYKGMVPIGKFGFVILNVEIDPKKVDVNVHPAKLEVRFEEEGKVFKAVYHAIKSGLAKTELVENIANPTSIKKIEDVENEKKENEESTDVENEIEDTSDEFKPHRNAFTGFFKKLIKEPEETKEELENNNLREIFEYRKNAKERLFDDFNRTKNEKAIKEAGVVENEAGENEPALKLEEHKVNSDNLEIKLGNTIISSDTKELNFNINDALNSETVKIETTKFLNNLDSSKTEKIDSLRKLENENKESSILKKIESKESVGLVKETKKEQAETEVKEEAKELDIASTDISNINDLKQENTESVTEKLLKMKMEADIDDTQLIDTAKVRDGISNVTSPEPITKDFANMYKKVFGMDVSSVRKNKEEEEAKINASSSLKYVANQENMSLFEEKDTYVPEIKYKFIGIIFDTYIIIEIKDEMYLIDQHAAHERIMYEKVKANYYSDMQKDSQMLLLADIITLTHKEMSIARENIDMFRQAGFDFEEFGENTIKLIAVPSMCEELNTKKLFLEILDEMDTVAVTAKQEKEDKFIATVACKAAVKGNMKLDPKEVESLMKKLLSLQNPFTCPHGRPTAIKLTRNDLEKKFSRR